MTTIYYYITLILICISQFCAAHDKNIDSLIKNFKKEVAFSHKHFGRIIWDSEMKLSYYSLMNICPVDTLINLTSDTDPVIRSYSFLELARRKIDVSILQDIIHKHENDTASYSTSSTDVVQSWKVIESMKFTYELAKEQKLLILIYEKEIAKIRDELHIVIKGNHHGFIRKSDLLNLDRLAFSKIGFKVLSFDIRINNKSLAARSNVVTGEMKSEIEKLKVGDRVYFESLKVKGPDNKVRSYGSVTLTIAQ